MSCADKEHDEIFGLARLEVLLSGDESFEEALSARASQSGPVEVLYEVRRGNDGSGDEVEQLGRLVEGRSRRFGDELDHENLSVPRVGLESCRRGLPDGHCTV